MGSVFDCGDVDDDMDIIDWTALTGGNLVNRRHRTPYVSWHCPKCKAFRRVRNHPLAAYFCLCGEPMPKADDRRIPAAEKCEVDERTDAVARRIVEIALG